MSKASELSKLKRQDLRVVMDHVKDRIMVVTCGSDCGKRPKGTFEHRQRKQD
jgi:hypothetical protein